MKKFSIILPVRNGGNYIKECIDSILNQQFQDFDLIILENNSADNTLDIIDSYNSTKIIVYPSKADLNIEQNWARILNIPNRGEYITLIGHDDVLQPNYLDIMNDLIRQYPDASLYQTHFNFINGSSEAIRNCQQMDEVINAEDFCYKVLASKLDIMGTGFMMKSEYYDKVGGMPSNYPKLLYADLELWMNMALISYVAVSNEYGFSFRIHPNSTTTISKNDLFTPFDILLTYLEKLKSSNLGLNDVIDKGIFKFIERNMEFMILNLLRLPKNKRMGLMVRTVIEHYSTFAKKFKPNSFNPYTSKRILLFKIVDSNFLSRNLYQLLKKIYRKPILK